MMVVWLKYAIAIKWRPKEKNSVFSYFLIGGHFSDDIAECRPSGYIRKLFRSMMLINPQGDLHNGGQFKDLENILHHTIPYDVVLWMPDIPNGKPKLVREIKKRNPKVILVTSKNNQYRPYSFMELVARALQVKANLFVEFQRGGKQIIASVCDPLGNQYVFSENIDEIAVALVCRLRDLCAFTRVGSVVSSKEEVHFQDNEELRSFWGLVKKYAETFHELIHPADSSRFLGNASFRCEYGFPSFKKNDQVFISKRNVDKRDIGVEAFVPVDLIYCGENPKVFYHGKDKPSVDSPIQLMLYNYYPNIRYMLHSHVYITGAPITSRRIPCGAIEEFFEIIQQFPMRDIDNLSLNLLGHGSLVMAKDISYLENIDYKARTMPETSEVEICPTCQGDGIARDGGYP